MRAIVGEVLIRQRLSVVPVMVRILALHETPLAVWEVASAARMRSHGLETGRDHRKHIVRVVRVRPEDGARLAFRDHTPVVDEIIVAEAVMIGDVSRGHLPGDGFRRVSRVVVDYGWGRGGRGQG